MKERIFMEKNGSEVRIMHDIKEGKVYFTVIDASYDYVGEDVVELNLFENEVNKYFEEIKEAYRIVLDGQIDTPRNCCFSNATAYLKGYDFDDMKDILAMLDELTVEDFNAFVKNVFKSDFVCISLVGNIKEKDVQTLEELRTLFYK